MKTKLLLTCVVVMLLCGCKSNYPVAQQTGKEDVAYLLFASPEMYAKKYVTVTLDDLTFDAKVVKSKNANRKGTSYAISPGRRKIKVEFEGALLYEKELFISTQETKLITLP